MKTKTKRIINASVWAAIAIVLCICVIYQWHAQGCGAVSLIFGVLWHSVLPLVGWIFFDEAIREYDRDMSKNRKG